MTQYVEVYYQRRWQRAVVVCSVHNGVKVRLENGLVKAFYGLDVRLEKKERKP